MPNHLTHSPADGTSFGWGPTELISFYGAQPIPRPVIAISQDTAKTLDRLLNALDALGLIARGDQEPPPPTR